jgi:DNA-binding SARP family transcriptional activator/tetratricopeptide (TPR) repeat protein
MKSLSMRVLSDFGVDGVEPQSLGSRKGRLALQLLALGGGQVVATDVLIDGLWEGMPPARPEDQLAVLVSRLRSVLGRDRIEHRDGGYVLHCDWLDSVELAALAEEAERRLRARNVLGAAAVARVAMSLARRFRPSRVPGDWAQGKLAELDQMVRRSRRVAALALLEAGDWMTAADAAALALEHDSYDEESLRLLLRAYVMGGRVASALEAYEQMRERLATDLGTGPSPQTSALHLAILRGEVASVAAPPVPASAVLVGRDEELAYLDAAAVRARGGSAELIVVDGEAGIGKTALLRHWADRRAGAGDLVLASACGQLDLVLPLDALLRGLSALLSGLGADVAGELLGSDEPTLAPLLGPAPGSRWLPVLADTMLGPSVLYSALLRVFERLAGRWPLAIIVDDAHLGGSPLSSWLSYARRAELRIPIVAAVRAGEGPPMPATSFVHLRALTREAAAKLVGQARGDELYERSKGHPLFLTELAQQPHRDELPASLIESVSARCDALGATGMMLRAAAIIGPELDIELLAAVLGQPAVEVLDGAERAAARQLLAEDGGGFRFRHELVREALAAGATAGRAALLHRQAGRVLAARPVADPVIVAHHARLGGDLVLAARSLRDAAGQAAERFDYVAAEALLDDALSLHPDPASYLERARVRTHRRQYGDALHDVEHASAGSDAMQVGAWACYFDRQFAQATQFAQDGVIAAADQATRSRCLAVGGRIRHAAGDLAGAEPMLSEACALAEGSDRVTAAAWLGVLRAHQSRTEEALTLLRPAARAQQGVEHTSATLHSLLFSGHAHALAGRPALALGAFSRCGAEVERRQAPRFAGRAVNFTGWVLRNLGAIQEARDRHLEALEEGRSHGTPEVEIAALEDLAEYCLETGDLDGARSRLAEAEALLGGDLVFGWRLRLKLKLVSARLELRAGHPETGLAQAAELEAGATALGIPRYRAPARLLACRARLALGQAVDRSEVVAALDAIEAAAAIEAWWWTGETAAEFAVRDWLDRAARQADDLARNADDRSGALKRAAAARLDGWHSSLS